MGLQLAEEEVPAKILQLHAGQAALIQDGAGYAGDRFRPQGTPEFF